MEMKCGGPRKHGEGNRSTDRKGTSQTGLEKLFGLIASTRKNRNPHLLTKKNNLKHHPQRRRLELQNQHKVRCNNLYDTGTVEAGGDLNLEGTTLRSRGRVEPNLPEMPGKRKDAITPNPTKRRKEKPSRSLGGPGKKGDVERRGMGAEKWTRHNTKKRAARANLGEVIRKMGGSEKGGCVFVSPAEGGPSTGGKGVRISRKRGSGRKKDRKRAGPNDHGRDIRRRAGGSKMLEKKLRGKNDLRLGAHKSG